MTSLDEHGLSPAARKNLSKDVQRRVAQAWAQGRALILNANKPGYSEAFTIEAEQYRLVRRAILEALGAGDEVLLKEVVAYVQTQLGAHKLFPKGRMTNYARYTKTDMEARGELRRVAGSSPQRLRPISQ